MIELLSGMDPRSLEICRVEPDQRRIGVGYIQWHSFRKDGPGIVIREAFGHLSLEELKTVLSKYEQHRKKFQ